MSYKYNQRNTKTPIALFIRYQLKHPRIISLIPDHFTALEKIVKAAGGTKYHLAPLIESMGITQRRWKAILEGSMPTLGEAVGYAEYFELDISAIYKVIPIKKTKKQAA